MRVFSQPTQLALKMGLDGYKIRDQHAVHFITFATVQLIDVFIRNVYANIIIKSLSYCQKEKSLLHMHNAKSFASCYLVYKQ